MWYLNKRQMAKQNPFVVRIWSKQFRFEFRSTESKRRRWARISDWKLSAGYSKFSSDRNSIKKWKGAAEKSQQRKFDHISSEHPPDLKEHLSFNGLHRGDYHKNVVVEIVGWHFRKNSLSFLYKSTSVLDFLCGNPKCISLLPHNLVWSGTKLFRF